MIRNSFIVLSTLVIINSSCDTMSKTSSAQASASQVPTLSFTPGPSVMVYKTKKEYSNFVPVILSDDKSSIVSYPAPADVKDGDGLRLPIALKDGYLLDRKGINKNVAFLKLTYAEYAALEKAPSKASLMELIMDSDPLTELCNCGNKNAFEDETAQLNALIVSGKLRTECKVLK